MNRPCFALWLGLAMVSAASCASQQHGLVRADGTFSARDFLRTARDALVEAETDADGHRIRAQLETQAALEVVGATPPARLVPYQGPPSLAVALELLEQSEPELQRRGSGPALDHAKRAMAELRAALGRPPPRVE